MGSNLAMNNAAILTDRWDLNAQCLTNGTATLARTHQSDQGNFPWSESVFSREKAYVATRRTRELPTLQLLPPRPAPRCWSARCRRPPCGHLRCSRGCRPLRRLLLKVTGCCTHGGPKVRIIKSSSARRRSIRLSVLVARLNAPSPGNIRILYAPQQIPFHGVNQDSVAHMQFMRRLIALPLSCRERSSRSQRSSTRWIPRGWK
jgi:hypothetical protein